LNPRAFTVIVSTIAIVIGSLGYLVISKRRGQLEVPAFVSAGFGIDSVYEALIIRPFLLLVDATRWLDSSVIGQGVTAIGQAATASGRLAQRTQRGDAQRYLSTAVSAAIFAVVIVLVSVVTA
jgi:NADH-quinone oxidoreductase subunit L